MSKYTDNEYPANWHAGGGESIRPLHEGGHYIHPYYRVLPGSNQHVERFLELRVDTVGMPPEYHHLELYYCTEDDAQVQQQNHLHSESIDVSDRTSQAQQEAAENEARERAIEVMEEYAGWRP
jgi:hypothetical protein